MLGGGSPDSDASSSVGEGSHAAAFSDEGLPGHLLQVCDILIRMFHFAATSQLCSQALFGGAADEESSSELMSAVRSLTGRKIRIKVYRGLERAFCSALGVRVRAYVHYTHIGVCLVVTMLAAAQRPSRQQCRCLPFPGQRPPQSQLRHRVSASPLFTIMVHSFYAVVHFDSNHIPKI